MRMMRDAMLAAAAVALPGTASAQLGAGPGMPTLVGEAESIDLETRMDPAVRAADARSRDLMDDADRSRSRRARDRAVAATRDDLAVGSEVRDSAGVPIARIAALNDQGVVLETSAGSKVEVGFDAFGKNRSGLLVGISKAQFDAAVGSSRQTP